MTNDAPHPPARRAPALTALVASAVLGVASAAGDWIWFHHLTDGAIAPAIVHGLLFFLLLAAVLAATCPDPGRAFQRLVLVLPAAGLVLAAAFYPVAVVLGYAITLLVAWAAMWLCLAFTYRRAAVARPPEATPWRDQEPPTRPSVPLPESLRVTTLRALIAAIGSGLAFHLVGDMWLAPSPDGPDLLQHSWRWTVAFAPGLLALLVDRPPSA